MMFPQKIYGEAGAYAAAYFQELNRAAAAVDTTAFDRAASLLLETIRADRTVYACGNGGSAAISNHLLCDFVKGIQTDTDLKPKIVSLSSHIELITAIANDISYDDIFLFQLKPAARAGDVLLTISSSGNSENIVRALAWARTNGVKTVALTGFGGGRSVALADINIHVPSNNYGIVEDLHQSSMHTLAQFIRMKNMPANLVTQRKF
jgi:D-sedoheptulose 7-phosphate isomerase